MRKYEKKVKKLNADNEFISFLTREEDLRFQMNTERNQGKLEGEKIGKEIGKKNEQLEIAHKMIEENFDVNMISKITDLSKETIYTLKRENKMFS